MISASSEPMLYTRQLVLQWSSARAARGFRMCDVRGVRFSHFTARGSGGLLVRITHVLARQFSGTSLRHYSNQKVLRL